MNRTTSQRAEEARRLAQTTALKAKQAQSALLKERAAALAVDAQKVGNLRALRLAKEAETKQAADAAASQASEAKVAESKAVRSKRRAAARVAKGAAPEMADADDMERQA